MINLIKNLVRNVNVCLWLSLSLSYLTWEMSLSLMLQQMTTGPGTFQELLANYSQLNLKLAAKHFWIALPRSFNVLTVTNFISQVVAWDTLASFLSGNDWAGVTWLVCWKQPPFDSLDVF